MLKEGDFAPDFEIQTLLEEPSRLSLSDAVHAGRNVVLVFLRQLGSPFCREHVRQLSLYPDRLNQLNAQVWLVSFAAPREARAWLDRTRAPFWLLLDPQRSVYRAYGLPSSASSVYNLDVARRYARHVLAGGWPGRITADTTQLGGDVIVDDQGIVRFAHESRNPMDRPPVETLFDALFEIEATRLRAALGVG